MVTFYFHAFGWIRQWILYDNFPTDLFFDRYREFLVNGSGDAIFVVTCSIILCVLFVRSISASLYDSDRHVVYTNTFS